jgi:hypothetical protein
VETGSQSIVGAASLVDKEIKLNLYVPKFEQIHQFLERNDQNHRGKGSLSNLQIELLYDGSYHVIFGMMKDEFN